MRRVAVITGGRSDRGILDILIEAMREVRLDVTVIATGSSTDGDIVVDMLLTNDSDDAVARSTGIGIYGMVDALRRADPECVVLLGDRYEILAAAIAAHLMGVPIAHLHGGEITLGSKDDKMRNAITALADIHFPSNYVHAKRVRHLANEHTRVYNVGTVGLAKVRPKGQMSPNGWVNYDDVEHPFILVSVPAGEPEICEAIAAALEVVAPAQMLWIGPNADAGRDKLKSFSSCDSIGHSTYLAKLALADCLVGNSSSGIIEAHSAGTPSVQVGDRQSGRTRPPSVIDCEVDRDDIVAAIQTALEMEVEGPNPYGTGDAPKKIAAILCEL